MTQLHDCHDCTKESPTPANFVALQPALREHCCARCPNGGPGPDRLPADRTEWNSSVTASQANRLVRALLSRILQWLV